MGRRIFVGDIQGCREPLQRLLDAVQFALGSDRLLPAGDLVNKGPDSPGTLALLMQLGAEPVLGKHDLHWLRKATDQEPAQRAWRQSQPFARCFDHVPLVHAGLRPRWDEAKLRGPLTDAEVDYLVSRNRSATKLRGHGQPDAFVGVKVVPRGRHIVDAIEIALRRLEVGGIDRVDEGARVRQSAAGAFHVVRDRGLKLPFPPIPASGTRSAHLPTPRVRQPVPPSSGPSRLTASS
ncbi:MAG: metallophosphoesterase [Planctomycetota bacterium]